MKRSLLLIVSFVAFVLSGHAAYAQTATVEIPFDFVTADKPQPAGRYTFELTKAGPLMLAPVGDVKGRRVMMAVITRLGRHDKDAEPELVFDKVAGAMHLSEVWFPDQDGLLLLGTGETHEHHVLRSRVAR